MAVLDKRITGKKVLFITDDPVSRYLLPMQLDATGLVTIDTTSGENAIELLDMHPDIALILVDMPLIDGFTAVSILREYEHVNHIPILALSEQRLRESRIAYLTAGANDYVLKSLNINPLIGKINHYVLEAMSAYNDEVLERVQVAFDDGGSILLTEAPDQKIA